MSACQIEILSLFLFFRMQNIQFVLLIRNVILYYFFGLEARKSDNASHSCCWLFGACSVATLNAYNSCASIERDCFKNSTNAWWKMLRACKRFFFIFCWVWKLMFFTYMYMTCVLWWVMLKSRLTLKLKRPWQINGEH